MKSYIRIIVFLTALLFSVLIFVFRDRLMVFQGYGLFGLFIISIVGASTIIVPVPVILAAFVAGAIFNPFVVAFVVSVGSTLGELTGYMAGFGAEELISTELRFQKVKKWMSKHGPLTLFTLAAIPNPLFDLAGIVAGATEMSIIKFLTFVFIGKLIKFTALAFIGAHSLGLIDRFL